MLIKSNRPAIQSYKGEERTFGAPSVVESRFNVFATSRLRFHISYQDFEIRVGGGGGFAVSQIFLASVLPKNKRGGGKPLGPSPGSTTARCIKIPLLQDLVRFLLSFTIRE